MLSLAGSRVNENVAISNANDYIADEAKKNNYCSSLQARRKKCRF